MWRGRRAQQYLQPAPVVDFFFCFFGATRADVLDDPIAGSRGRHGRGGEDGKSSKSSPLLLGVDGEEGEGEQEAAGVTSCTVGEVVPRLV